MACQPGGLLRCRKGGDRNRVGVDPVRGGTLRLTSDEFFRLSNDRFDLVFIDGLHHAEQVCRDVRHAQLALNPGGVIILHDCNPQSEAQQSREPLEWVWHGDVWKAFVLFRQELNLDAVVGDFDGGIGLIRVRPNPAPLKLEVRYLDLTWPQLVQNRQLYLRLMSSDEIKRWI